MARSRTRQEVGPMGTLATSAGPVTTIPVLKQETVIDEVLPGNGHKFDLKRYGVKDQLIAFNGKILTIPQTTVATNFIVPRHARFDEFLEVHEPIGGVPSTASAAAELCAKTNPSRPHIDLFAFAAELKDIPGLLRKRTDDLSRDISSKRLSLEFGWKPLIGDLLKFLNLVEAFDDRLRELDHLSRSGLRRKRQLFSGASTPRTIRTGNLFNNRGFYVDATVVNVTKIDVWGFCRWVPDVESWGSKLGVYDIGNPSKALLTLLGITPTLTDLSAIWEILPFSWLADWCSNTGDLLAANRNTVGAVPKDICIMFHKYTESTMTLTNIAPGFTANRYTSTRYREDKYRDPVSSLTLEAHIPFLNERKVAILADVVNGIFRRSKIDARRDAKTTWKPLESSKGS